jgi:hypothetical protein
MARSYKRDAKGRFSGGGSVRAGYKRSTVSPGGAAAGTLNRKKRSAASQPGSGKTKTMGRISSVPSGTVAAGGRGYMGSTARSKANFQKKLYPKKATGTKLR